MHVIPVLYFHGFASSPRSQKVQSLRERLAAENIVLDACDLNIPTFAALDFDAIVSRGRKQAGEIAPRALVGSSLGALVALAVSGAGHEGAPLILIAPALGVSDRWLSRLPDGDPILVHHHAHNAALPIHRAFFQRMAAVDIDRKPPASRVTILMGENDESVPFDRVAAVWRSWEESGQLVAGSRFIEIPGGDHGLTAHVEQIALAIIAATKP